MLEDLNFYYDTRVVNAGLSDQTDRIWDSLLEADMIRPEYTLPTCWVVCPTCDGAGKHVNPAIDCNGLTAEDFYADPDFMEEYVRGDYDVPCRTCNGRTTVKEIDLHSVSEPIRKYIEQWLEDEAECRAERAMGC